jgi:hypothetical protein
MSVAEIKELERAILDTQTDSLGDEVELNLARFRGHKQALLSLLRKTCARRTKAASFDEAESWLRIETTARQYFALKILKQQLASSAGRKARYRAIANTLRRARNELENAKKAKVLDFAGDSIRVWLDGTKEITEATKQFEFLLYLEVDIQNVLKTLIDLEAAATQVAAEAHKRRGRPKGDSILPWNYSRELEKDYKNSTGLNPGAGPGPFARFVKAFVTAVGENDPVESTLVDVIKDARSYSSRTRAKPSRRSTTSA